MTHTYAVLKISPEAFCEIKLLLEAACYQHAFHKDDLGAITIDMHGIGLAQEEASIEAVTESDANLPTHVRLALALVDLYNQSNDRRVLEMAARARAMYYDDFNSPIDAPKTTLIAELRACNQGAMAERVSRGDFDNTTAEGDQWIAAHGARSKADGEEKD